MEKTRVYYLLIVNSKLCEHISCESTSCDHINCSITVTTMSTQETKSKPDLRAMYALDEILIYVEAYLLPEPLLRCFYAVDDSVKTDIQLFNVTDLDTLRQVLHDFMVVRNGCTLVGSGSVTLYKEE